MPKKSRKAPVPYWKKIRNEQAAIREGMNLNKKLNRGVGTWLSDMD
jgi:hypothetical protein